VVGFLDFVTGFQDLRLEMLAVEIGNSDEFYERILRKSSNGEVKPKAEVTFP